MLWPSLIRKDLCWILSLFIPEFKEEERIAYEETDTQYPVCNYLAELQIRPFTGYQCFLNILSSTYLVVQWLRIYLPMQGTLVQSLVWEDFAHADI